jgi:curved DNA-binding protein
MATVRYLPGVPERDLYQILGVPRTAAADEIKKTYRKLARQLHPDVNPGNAQAEERFKEVTAAFEVLSDPKRRALYDEFGADSLRSGFDAARAEEFRRWRRQGAPPGSQPFDFGDFATVDVEGFGPFDFGTIFGSIFGQQPGNRSRRAPPAAGRHLEAEIELELRDAVLGGERDVMVDGRRLRVSIKPGVFDGARIRLAGQGHPGRHGGQAGDLLLRVRLRPHPLVRLEGKDLSLDLPLTIPEAALGAEVTLPTFEGRVSFQVAPGTQSGARIRLKGKGLPDLKGGPRGDLYAVARVVLPPPGEKLDKAARALEPLYKDDPRAAISL